MFNTNSTPKHRRTRLTVEALESRDCPSYAIVNLLPPPGGLGNGSGAAALNDNGLVVGDGPQVSGYGRAAVWQVGAGATAAGTFLPQRVGDNYSDARGVNNGGLIAGVSGVVGSGPSHAVVWVGGGGSYAVHDLGILPSTLTFTFTSSSAGPVSEPDANGVIWVVGASRTSGNFPISHPTIWRIDSAGTVLSMIDLEPAEPARAWANDVRVVGSTVLVVGDVNPAASGRARVWTLDLAGNVQSQTTLGTLGGPFSTGQSINSQGHVAGWSDQTNTSPDFGYIHRDGAMTNLGSLGTEGSWAEALNDSDTVVGHYWIKVKGTTWSQPRAFVWQGGPMLDLRGQLSSAARGSWANLFYAFDVNAKGQIVGEGSVKIAKGRYEQHGYIATPPALNADSIASGVDVSALSADQLQPSLTAALQRWQAAGADASRLSGLDIRIADLGGTTLGLASGNTIWIDRNAAGWGWFVDKTPRNDSEFRRPGNQGEKGRMDLLTVLAHELGHVLGFDHEDGGVMAETLGAGVRRPPVAIAHAHAIVTHTQLDWAAILEAVHSGKR